MNYYINSNTGDYISEDKDKDIIKLHLISRVVDGVWLIPESIKITKTQFSVLKGFIPIKQKKLFSRKSWMNQNKYAPTLSDGTKGKSERVKLPTQSEVRDEILKQLGIK